jgi:hypothetical protein
MINIKQVNYATIRQTSYAGFHVFIRIYFNLKKKIKEYVIATWNQHF